MEKARSEQEMQKRQANKGPGDGSAYDNAENTRVLGGPPGQHNQATSMAGKTMAAMKVEENKGPK